MTRPGVAGARFRQRKLSTKQSLQILNEDQVEKLDDDQQRNNNKVDTGVEKGEEGEHHLQKALSASQGGKIAQVYIPTPDAIQSNIQYDRLYPLRFQQPATYIRFSSTVEDCSGCQYCMSSEDDEFLKTLNQNKSVSTQCTEDQFEEVMDCFEQTSQAKQPFAAVDNPPVVGFDEMQSLLEERLDEHVRAFAEEIYEHWKSSRINEGGKALMSSLKFETGQETDDADPYVCFRRREMRQVRKTRGRDAQSTEKLRKLRKELEEARQLVELVVQREKSRKDILGVDKALFEQRLKVKEAKRRLGIKTDDEDLVNQKPQKKKAIDQLQSQRPAGPQLKLPVLPNGRSAEADLVQLHDILAEKENEIQRDIESKLAQHRQWNAGYIDLTRLPLTPTSKQSSNAGFRTAITEYLPTPPASVSSEASGDAEHADLESPSHGRNDSVTVRCASPTHDSGQSRPSFRRRIGRGGRLMIDRRGMHSRSKEGIDPIIQDRFKFDRDEDEDEPMHPVDLFDALSMRYRASFIPIIREQSASRPGQTHSVRPAQRELPQVATQSTVGKPGNPQEQILSSVQQG
ncbi:MAG: Enhancer of polycomb-like protein 1 [Piccolia ochrophora]|nr:MAG: Enhancer of polycomb-like protein 1 [Piccolia ochrophora]